jgi:hypothetical protein
MKIEKTYSIKKGAWTQWTHTLADAIDDFYKIYRYYPNILEANDHTLSQFDFLVNINPDERQHVVQDDDVTGITKLPDKTENIVLNSFDYCNIADIDFAIDNQLADKAFRLVYDDDPEWDTPEWDQPEIPDECPEKELEVEYKIL